MSRTVELCDMSEDSRTTSRPLFLERRPIEGTCPRCGAEQLCGYPVNSEGGWFDVVKCQYCLLSVSRERGPRLGPIRLLTDQL
ncbi:MULTISPECIES: hypothetical protein [unclassified Streptomyces]|nr:hypothetical protein [Streptomyces sp. e14]